MIIKVYVKVLSGRMMSVRVGEQRLVESVKNQILSKLRMPTDSKGWLYHTMSRTGELAAMENDKTISQCGIKSGAILYFSMAISVKVKMIAGGGKVIINIRTNDSIQEVKQKIHVSLGIPPEEQRLIFHGKLVEDNGAVQDYGIENNDELYLIRRICQYDLLISNSSTGHDLTVKVEPSSTVMNVKVAIAKSEQIPIHQQQLMFHNILLDDGKTVKHYGIGRGCKVTLDVHQCSSGQIFIRTLVGKIITVDIGVNDTVAKVKSVIECKEGIPPNQQKLTFMGKILQNSTLGTYRVQKENTLDLSLCISGGANGSRRMKICVKRGKNGPSFKIEVASANTITELKEKIHTQERIPPDKQRLIFNGKVLEDYQTLEYYSIDCDDTLYLIVRHPEEIRITVRSQTSREICPFNELASEPIQTLIATIEDMEGIPKSYQRLIFNGEVLDDQKLLSGYNFVSDRQNIVYLEFIGPIQVFIHILSGMESATIDKRISVRADKEMKVSALKTSIEHREKIPVYLQRLHYEGKVMDNPKMLKDYFIGDKDIICLSLERFHHVSLSVAVKTPSNTLENLPNVGSHTRLEELKQSIQEKKDSSHWSEDGFDNSSIEQQNLFYGSALLNSDKSLRDYMVIDGSTLYLLPSGEFPVFVQASIDGTFTSNFIGVKVTDTIKLLKNNMKKYIDPLNHCLYLSSVLLDDNKTVEECRIAPTCTLHYVCSGEIPISVKTRHTTVSFGVMLSSPVATIMEMISHIPEIGVRRDKQRLLHHYQVLSELQEKSIKDCHISAGNILTLVVIPNELDLYITTSQGSTLTLVRHINDRIRDVKAAIEEIHGIPVENQILPFSDDEKTLKEEGYLSVVQVKTFIDRQMMWECAIIQTKHLEQEKKRLEWENKILEQDKKKLEREYRRLEQEKKRLEQEVVEEMELQLYSAMQYADKKMAGAKGENYKKTVVAKTIEAEFNNTTDGATEDDQFVYTGEELKWKKCNLQLHFPQQDIESNIQVSVTALDVSELDQYDIAKNAELISYVYQICVSERLPWPVPVELQHDVNHTHDLASTISFVHSNFKQDPPYQFQVIEGGHFKANTVYSKIELSLFANVAIAQFSAPFIYTVFMRKRSNTKCDVHIVVTPDIVHESLTEYKDWSVIAHREVEFEKDSISVDIPNEGKKSLEGGWKVTIMQYPAEITKQSVNEYKPGTKAIPHIRLRVMCTQSSPIEDDVNVALTGTKGPASFTIECEPTSESVSMASHPVGGMNILSEPVDLKLLNLIKYKDDKGKKELRIQDRIKSRWRDLALHLGFKEPGKLENFEQSQSPFDTMMTKWLQGDTQSSWSKLICKMNDAGLKRDADDLKYALLHMTQ